VAEVGDVAAALGRWLAERGEARAVALTGRATVGLSQDTYFVRVDGSGADHGVDAVLRLPTPASGPQAIRTQRAALQAVTGRLPAPALLWHDDGETNPFGRPFLVMERVGGSVPVGWHDVEEPRRTALAEAAIDTLAELHRIDPAALAGAAAAVESPTGFAFLARRLERFAPLPPVLRGALWWLARHEPEPATATLVHGDYRMGNFVVDDDRGLRAVLDWEMAGPGDPVSDLAWCFLPVWETPGVDERALVRRYEERSGSPVDADRLHWHRVLGYVRLAYYALGGIRAFERRRSDDLRLAALALQLPVHLDRLAATLAGEPVT
jgi:aminoglycoside phosphotransferase (APT) family kinase protein